MSEPRRRRPGFPEYGIAEQPEGMLEWAWATERLERARNYWVSTTTPDGAPHAMPVWGVWYEDAFWFGTGERSRKGRNLARDPRIVVHLESGDEVVILEGTAEQTPIADELVQTYNAKYEMEAVSSGGTLWRVRHTRGFAWREHDYPQSATRFDF